MKIKVKLDCPDCDNGQMIDKKGHEYICTTCKGKEYIYEEREETAEERELREEEERIDSAED